MIFGRAAEPAIRSGLRVGNNYWGHTYIAMVHRTSGNKLRTHIDVKLHPLVTATGTLT